MPETMKNANTNFESHGDVILESLDIIVVYVDSEAYVNIGRELKSWKAVIPEPRNVTVVFLNQEFYVQPYLVFENYRHVLSNHKFWV